MFALPICSGEIHFTLRQENSISLILICNLKKGYEGTPTIKQVLPPEKEKRGADDLFVLLSHALPCKV